MTDVPIQIPHPEITAAMQGLTALLLGDLTLDDRLTVGDALGILVDVVPPHPPLDDPTSPPRDVEAAFSAVRGHLLAAIDTAPSPEEAIRCGTAARVLIDLPHLQGAQ
jgi:hypothetical protein